MKKKNVTIDDLARMVERGFAETGGKVDNLEGWAKHRFDNIDSQLRDIRKQLSGVVYRNEFERLETRVKELEELLALPSKRK